MVRRAEQRARRLVLPRRDVDSGNARVGQARRAQGRAPLAARPASVSGRPVTPAASRCTSPRSSPTTSCRSRGPTDRAVRLVVAAGGRRMGRDRPVAARRDPGHVARAQAHAETGVARDPSHELRAVRVVTTIHAVTAGTDLGVPIVAEAVAGSVALAMALSVVRLVRAHSQVEPVAPAAARGGQPAGHPVGSGGGSSLHAVCAQAPAAARPSSSRVADRTRRRARTWPTTRRSDDDVPPSGSTGPASRPVEAPGVSAPGRGLRRRRGCRTSAGRPPAPSSALRTSGSWVSWSSSSRRRTSRRTPR